MNLVCLGKNFGDRNFSYAWYKLKLICVLRVGLSKVSLLKWCTLVLSVVLRKYLSTLQNFSAVSAVLSSTQGLICAFRGPRLGGFHPVPGTWIVRKACVVCTKHRKSVSRQFFSRDKPSGIDNTDASVSLVTPSTDLCVMPETCTERRDKLTS